MSSSAEYLKLHVHVETAIMNAELNTSKINNDILGIDGMTGVKTRHFYNNILNINDARYLEIGSWKGSSVCSAMYNNNAKIVCIDNWSQFGNHKDEFIGNLTKYKGINDVSLIESDCFQVDVNKLPKCNIYMYDGDHRYIDQYMALIHYYECLDDIFIFIIDDWNEDCVREGTFNSFKTLGINVLYKKEIFTPANSTKDTWWNGMCVTILEKKKRNDITPRMTIAPDTPPTFNENWYSKEQIDNLKILCNHAKKLNGAIIEIGCWEGRSAVNIANECYPENMICNDTWLGNVQESAITGVKNISEIILEKRDVYKIFLDNMNILTKGNYKVVRQDCNKWLKEFNEPIKFIHIDACHDYESVYETIKLALPHMIHGGIMCGDDYLTANINRADLHGGVERAVRETLPAFQSAGNLWYYIHRLY